MNKPACLFVVSGPSGVGKTGLVKALVEGSEKLVISISHTTRSKRSEEVDGLNYHFVPESEFKDMVKRGEFLAMGGRAA